MNDLKSFLNNFLEIINYTDDRDEFVNKLIQAIYSETLETLIQTLPQDRQLIIKQSFESAKTPDLLQQAVNTTFDQKLFNDTFQKTSQKLFTEYLETIDEALTEDQKMRLKQYSSSLKQPI